MVSFNFCKMKKNINTFEINFSGVAFFYIRMKTFLFLEITLRRRFICFFFLDNDLLFRGILVVQPLK